MAAEHGVSGRRLRPFQVEALNRVARQNLYLAAKPGSGKTAVAVHAAHSAMYDAFAVRRTLVVAPLRVVPQFAAEAAAWGLPLTFAHCIGPEGERLAALAARTDVLVTSHDHFPWLCRTVKASEWDFDFVVYDEADRLRKGGRQGSVGWKAMDAIRRKQGPRIMLMSGTPRPGTAHELFAPVYLLDGGQRLGKTLGGFRAAYLEPHKVDRNTGRPFSWRLRAGMEGALYGKIEDLFYAVSPDLGIQMLEIDRHVDLPAEVERQIDRLRRELVADFDWTEITAASAGVAAGKMLQLAGGAVFDDDGQVTEVHACKVDALRELIEELDGEPLVVGYWYTHERERLLREFPAMVDITTPKGLADAKAGRVQLGLLHPQSAGHGIDGLQQHFAAFAWYTLPFSYGLYEQAVRRLARSGQAETVRVFRLLAGPDVLVREALDRKRGEQERFYDFLTG